MNTTNYIKNHRNGIEEKARRMFGETDIFQFAGYILEDGTMLNFSYGGYQRDEDHRIIGQFFSKAQGTEALLKFMRRGNVRVMCHNNSYCFEYMGKLTRAQKSVIMEAAKEAETMNIDFMLEKDNRAGKPISRWYDRYELYEAM